MLGAAPATTPDEKQKTKASFDEHAESLRSNWAPNATITITPTDHYVAPAAAYVDQIAAAQNIARRLRNKVILLGVAPTEPAELGYLSLGERVTDVPEVRVLPRFIEKSSASVAQGLIDQGALWSTMVTCGTVDALWELGRAADPHLLEILDSLVL